jgi:hypothetical protein
MDAVGMGGTRLTIDLDVERGEALRGQVGRVDTEATRGFVGWLGLVAALDALISGSPSTGAAARRLDMPSTDGKRL